MRRKPDFPARVADLPPAPGQLAIVQAFVNTADFEHGSDELSGPLALGKWLARWIPANTPAQLAAVDVELAAGVREALREVIGGNNRGEVSAEAIARLDAAAAVVAARVRFDADGSHRWEAGPGSLDGALGLILAIVARARDRGRWPRLKACANPACRAVFWDASTNRSAVWCSMRRCGNRTSQQRRQRRRRRSKSAGRKARELTSMSPTEARERLRKLEAQTRQLVEESGGFPDRRKT